MTIKQLELYSEPVKAKLGLEKTAYKTTRKINLIAATYQCDEMHHQQANLPGREKHVYHLEQTKQLLQTNPEWKHKLIKALNSIEDVTDITLQNNEIHLTCEKHEYPLKIAGNGINHIVRLYTELYYHNDYAIINHPESSMHPYTYNKLLECLQKDLQTNNKTILIYTYDVRTFKIIEGNEADSECHIFIDTGTYYPAKHDPEVITLTGEEYQQFTKQFHGIDDYQIWQFLPTFKKQQSK